LRKGLKKPKEAEVLPMIPERDLDDPDDSDPFA
jgi:hypothetical protein